MVNTQLAGRVSAESRFPLTPLQEGMLFHAVGVRQPGVDVEHITFDLGEVLDAHRLVDAWREVTIHHPVLHSAVGWDRGEPRLVADPAAALPVTRHDWRLLDGDDQTRRWATLVHEDRVRGFTMDEAPLQRVVLVRLEEARWRGLWSFHHLILDGRSFPIVLRDVFGRYDGTAEPGPRAGVWLHTDAVRNADRSEDEVFWKAELNGFEPALPLRILDPSTATITESPSNPLLHVAERRLNVGTTAAVTRAADALGVSVNNLVQAAWSIVMHRYHGSGDIVFGSTRACRHVVPEGDELVGLLINTVPFRVAVDRQDRVADLVHQVRETHRNLRQVETTPLTSIKEWAGIDPAAELFTSLVMFDQATLGRRLADLGDHRRFDYDGHTNVPLTLLAYADPEMLLRVEAHPDHLNAKVTERLVDQVATALCWMIADPDRPVGDVDPLTHTDRALLAGFNDTDVDLGPATTLARLLADQAAATPDRIAVSFGDSELSYAEFDERVRRVAARLAPHTAGNRAVGILAERSVEMLVAIHAVVRAGGAYVPLDPSHPTDRLYSMITDAEIGLVLATGDADAGRLGVPSLDVGVLMVEHPSDATSVPIDEHVAPEDAAYIIFTSGSTGRPKGVVNQHDGIVNRLRWMQSAFPLGVDDVVVQKTPITFDVSVWELFWPLIVGARLHIAAPGAHRDPRRLVNEITSSGATTIHFVPSMLALFLDEPSIETCSSLRRVICSGEALTPDLVQRAHDRLAAELHNLYGPTEAAVDVTWWPCDRDAPLQSVPIGRAIANTRMHVLDADLQPVPPGAVGELFIAGVQVARGYVNRPELNAERFLPAEAIEGEPARAYRTGDLGRHREDGALEYLGRTDHQVKIRGLRIELGEIEAVLADHTAVTNTVVVARPDRTGDLALVAYVTTDGPAGEGFDADLRDHLGRHLPDYMTPAVILVLDSLPLNSSGKVDRAQLPEPECTAPVADLPVGDVEEAVAAIWCELLDVDHVDRNVPFFAAGGHSLLVVRLAHALEARFEQPVDVADLIDRATVATQAALVAGAARSTPDDPLNDIATAAARRRGAARRRRRQRS